MRRGCRWQWLLNERLAVADDGRERSLWQSWAQPRVHSLHLLNSLPLVVAVLSVGRPPLRLAVAQVKERGPPPVPEAR
jgi:hypothetical protein